MRLLVLFTLLLTLPAFGQPIESFDSFIANFRAKALAAGVSGGVYDAAMGGLTPMPVQSALRHFPEDFEART